MMSDETNLADLLALNLHNFEDEVRNIVDKASKELSMEKTLGELDVTWSQMEFENETHNRTGYKMLRSSEELVETLEDNQVTQLHAFAFTIYTCTITIILTIIFSLDLSTILNDTTYEKHVFPVKVVNRSIHKRYENL